MSSGPVDERGRDLAVPATPHDHIVGHHVHTLTLAANPCRRVADQVVPEPKVLNVPRVPAAIAYLMLIAASDDHEGVALGDDVGDRPDRLG